MCELHQITTKPRSVIRRLLALPAWILVLVIRFYQKAISPWLGPCCRFNPSCSNYCIDALKQHGMVRGLWLGIKRILKCHPLHPGGYDPVPYRENKSTSRKKL